MRQCRERAAREGWNVVETYSDHAVSGATLIRSGIQSLLADAQAGRFDMVLSEALDRISRDQEDVAGIFKRLRFAGVTLFTLSEGEINELHVGLKVDERPVPERPGYQDPSGIRGRVEAGKIGCGNAYGYRVVHRLDARGEPIGGEREIIEEQAEVIRRTFREYVAGKGPQRIAADLNRDGISSPTGKRWNDSTIRGNHTISSGILNCELELLPVATVAGKPRHLPRCHRTDLAEADLGDHPVETGACDAAGGRAAEIVIDRVDARPAERGQTVTHGILKCAALAIVQDLMGGRLAHIQDCLPLQMMRPDLLIIMTRLPLSGRALVVEVIEDQAYHQLRL